MRTESYTDGRELSLKDRIDYFQEALTRYISAAIAENTRDPSDSGDWGEYNAAMHLEAATYVLLGKKKGDKE